MQQRIKANKWTCRRCGTSQSFMRKFAQVPTAKQAREALILISTSYHENQERKLQEESDASESARIYKTSYNAAFSAAAESLGVNAEDLINCEKDSRVQRSGVSGIVGSAWAEYLDEEERIKPISSTAPREKKRSRDIEDVVEEKSNYQERESKLVITRQDSAKDQVIPLPSPPPPLSIWDEL